MSVLGLGLVLLSAALQVGGTLLLRGGVDRAGGFVTSFADLPQGLLRLAGQPMFVFGFFLYGAAALVWFQVLSTQPLSVAYPLLVSLTFVFVTLGAITMFHEVLTARKLVGLVVILTGIYLTAGR